MDAFPDVTNIQVQVATEVPGRSPDEVERMVTVPVEIGMTGLPGMTEMRSQNEPGLSIVTLVFNDDTPLYFARQIGLGTAGRRSKPFAGRHRSGPRAGFHGTQRGVSIHARKPADGEASAHEG